MADSREEPDREDHIDPNAWRPQRHKIRRVVFTAKDEAILSEALRDSFATVTYLEHFLYTPPGKPGGFSSLADVPGRAALVVVPSQADWRPACEYCPQDGRWHFTNVPRHGQLTYYRPKWSWSGIFGDLAVAYDPPTLDEGQIFNSYEPWNPDHRNFLALVRTTWRIISRIATNRYKRGHPLGNRLSGCEYQLMKDAKGRDVWIGHHALEWCRQSPRRMLCGSLRAYDDWQVPQDDWYQSLRRRVDAIYGPDLGEAPSEPPPRDY